MREEASVGKSTNEVKHLGIYLSPLLPLFVLNFGDYYDCVQL
jgi:hypothetical protein